LLLLQIPTEPIVQILDELRAWRGRIGLGGSKLNSRSHGVDIPRIRPERTGPAVLDQRLHKGGEPAPCHGLLPWLLFAANRMAVTSTSRYPD
jgi:hypothetical protein